MLRETESSTFSPSYTMVAEAGMLTWAIAPEASVVFRRRLKLNFPASRYFCETVHWPEYSRLSPAFSRLSTPPSKAAVTILSSASYSVMGTVMSSVPLLVTVAFTVTGPGAFSVVGSMLRSKPMLLASVRAIAPRLRAISRIAAKMANTLFCMWIWAVVKARPLLPARAALRTIFQGCTTVFYGKS